MKINYKIERTSGTIKGARYVVKIYHDDKYTGFGRFFTKEKEAEDYIKSQKGE